MSPSFRFASAWAGVLLVVPLASCQRAEQEPVQAQRIAFDEVPSQGEEPLPSPDTKNASWSASANGLALNFGNPGRPPLVSLECDPAAGAPQVIVIRHAPTRAGEKALFPIIGNGKISRFAVDASHVGDEWRWQGAIPADDPLLDVFLGSRALEATLPGGGTVKIEGSDAPGQFISSCHDRAQPPSTPKALI
jgi:hypothetical protein